jgi:hypothetical protein
MLMSGCDILYIGGEYTMGSVEGKTGKSLKICQVGEKPVCGKTLPQGRTEITSSTCGARCEVEISGRPVRKWFTG